MSPEQEKTIQTAVEQTLKLVVNVHEVILHMAARQRPRHNLEANKRLVVRFLVAASRLVCPCCGRVQILSEEGILLPGVVFDHWNGPSDNSIENIWPLSGSCHIMLHRRLQVRQSKEIRFKAFQQDMREWLEQQIPYGIASEQAPLFPELPKSLKSG